MRDQNKYTITWVCSACIKLKLLNSLYELHASNANLKCQMTDISGCCRLWKQNESHDSCTAVVVNRNLRHERSWLGCRPEKCGNQHGVLQCQSSHSFSQWARQTNAWRHRQRATGNKSSGENTYSWKRSDKTCPSSSSVWGPCSYDFAKDQIHLNLKSWLVSSTPDRAVRVRALAWDIVLCSWARHLTPTVPLSTQVYKWVPANLMLGVTLRWTSIPSSGE